MRRIRLDEEAYELLCRARLTPKESFSRVVKRIVGQTQHWDDSAGGWSDVTEHDAARLRRQSIETFGRV